MNSHPESDTILDSLGDKFLSTLIESVVGSRADIDLMRAWQPSWFPRMHSRTLANLIHDRMWDRMVTAVSDDPGVVVIDHGVIRELQVGVNIRLRVKRHNDDAISTYETTAALMFYKQPTQLALDGLDPITLAIGYRWDREERRILAPVVSFRDGKNNPIWTTELDEPAAGTTAVIRRPLTGPELPSVEFGDDSAKETGTGTDEA
jgi:hypothetical protein